MASEKQLRNVLIEVFQHLQGQRSAISSLLAEVAAVRDSLIEIGPQYDDILSRHRARHVKASSSLAHEDLAKYDRIIQQLRDDDLG
jgi:hypothetical protein